MLYGYMYVYISRQPVTFQNERHFFSKNLSGSFVLNAGDFVVGVFGFFFQIIWPTFLALVNLLIFWPEVLLRLPKKFGWPIFLSAEGKLVH